MLHYYPVLTIAGSDPSGGAGIQADLKTFAAEGCYGMSVITAITAQNTRRVSRFDALPADLVEEQIRLVVEDIPPLAVKTGMLATADIAATVAEAVAQKLLPAPIVDPVMVSTSGAMLIEQETVEVMVERLFPQALLITPNAAEARALTSIDDPLRQISRLRGLGCRNILLKGGDVESTPGVKIDLLALEDVDEPILLSADAVETKNTHGTGCTLSSAIAARIALGDNLETAVRRAKLYVTRALEQGRRVKIGSGHGPVNHFFDPKRQKTRMS